MPPPDPVLALARRIAARCGGEDCPREKCQLARRLVHEHGRATAMHAALELAEPIVEAARHTAAVTNPELVGEFDQRLTLIREAKNK